jgi:hypothetical protein
MADLQVVDDAHPIVEDEGSLEAIGVGCEAGADQQEGDRPGRRSPGSTSGGGAGVAGRLGGPSGDG